MFGHKSDPAIVYRFGAKSPATSTEAVEEQYAKANRYRNKLCEIELQRRETVNAVLQKTPAARSWQEAQAKLDELQELIDAEGNAVKLLHSSGTPKSETADRRTKLGELKKERKLLAKVAKEAKAEAFANELIQQELAESGTVANGAIKAARASCGLYWGTYLKVEQDCQSFRRGKPPRFRRFEGDGTIAVQIQKGASWQDLIMGKCRGVKILPDAKRTTPKLTRVIARVVVGGGRTEPIYADFPTTIHRHIPDDAVVKWVYVTRERVASHFKYHLCFVVSRPCGWDKQDLATEGALAINVGWRTLPHGLRVGYWVGSDGKSGEISIPTKKAERWGKVDDLQSIRDERFNVAVDLLANWLVEHPDVPGWLKERTATIRRWHSQARLASVVLFWRDNRFAGDEEIYEQLEGRLSGRDYHGWRKKDKHLWEWEENQRRGNVIWRTQFYRDIAAKLSQQYKTLIVGDVNYAKLAKVPDIEADNRTTPAGKARTIASPGSFTKILKDRFAEVVVATAEHITSTCHQCGKLTPFDAAANLVNKCRHCGEIWDQDENAAKNLLSRGAVPCEMA